MIPFLAAETPSLLDTARLRAQYTSTAPVIDGRIDDPVWKTAASTSAFTEKTPIEGIAPAEATTFRVLYDKENVYVAFECVQRKSPIIRRLTRRDRLVESDWVSIAFDTRRDGKSAFEFTVNAAGVLVDTIRFNDTDASGDWDENWDARTALTDSGWSAEFKIPLRILRFASAANQTWGLQARRYTSTRQQTDEWAFTPRAVAGEVSHYGKLEGLVGLRAGTPLELRPFVVGRVKRQDSGDIALASGVDVAGSAGLDLKWHPTQGLTLDVTVNPDFAQVEADQVVLNLTKFETYYPEKRPFFLEGIDTFSTPFQLLYTRRIGRAAPIPYLRTSAPFNEQLYTVPDPATIYAASKLTGQIADKWTIGTLQAVTANNDVQVQLGDGTRQKRLVDPTSSFNVLRLKRDVGSNAHVGLIATAVTRAEPSTRHPIVPGDAQNPTTILCPSGYQYAPGSRCFNDAYVAALDWRWRSKSGEYTTGGMLTASQINRGPPRPIPDGTVIQPGDVGTSAYAWVAKEGGKHWVWFLEGAYGGRKFDVSDLGFIDRANVYLGNLWYEYRTLKPWWVTLETHTVLELNGMTNTDGLLLQDRIGLTTWGKLKNFWTYSNTFSYRPARYDDREVGDGTALQRDATIGHDLKVGTDPTKRVSFSFRSTTQFIFDGLNWNVNVGALLRVLPQLDLELLPTWGWTFGEPRYESNNNGVPNGNLPGQYLFGRLDAKSIGAVLRGTYTFTPRLTLQSYAQLFLASGHYSDYSQFVSDPAGPRPVVHLADLRPGPAPPLNADFAEGVLNVNVVLRWEYTLGSLLYLVYSRSQVPNTILAPGEAGTLDLGAVQRAPAADIFLVKLSYWWGGS